jgi:hypothetical protein
MPGLSLPLLVALAAPHAAPPPGRVEEFALCGPAGAVWRLSDARAARAVVVVFLNPGCPLAKRYAPRLAGLCREYRPQRVTFVGVLAGREPASFDLPFPVLSDPGHVVADRFAAERSPEAFVLDRERRVRYRGRIDDQYAVGSQKPRPSRRDLALALDAVLAGRPVAVPATAAPGCPLTREDRPTRPAGVTWGRDVAPIVRKRCAACHRPGQSGPFSLLRCADAAAHAGAVREAVADGRMPPWGADPRYGTFANDPSLAAAEKQTLLDWIDAGCPEGPAEGPAPPGATSARDGWGIPGPDRVLSMPTPFTVPAEGVLEYVYVRIDPGFREDRWVRAAQVLPGNPAVVHHCNVFLQAPGVADPEVLNEQGKLGSFCLTAAAPGTPPMVLPDGMAKRVPAGWRIVLVMHYQAVGSVQTDRTRLGLTFADPRTVRQEVATRVMLDEDLRIGPGEKDHRVAQTWAVRRDVLLLSFFPHMHLRGRSFRYELVHPGGTAEVLLDVPRYDFNWQHRYVLARPRRVAAGSRLRCTAVYDNSADNPNNPDPAAEVRTGPQSTDEMFNGYFDVVLADEDLTAGPPWRERVRQVCPPGAALLVCLAGGLYLGRRRIARAVGAAPSEPRTERVRERSKREA